jgi:hypothetical protein
VIEHESGLVRFDTGVHPGLITDFERVSSGPT